jgi:hypothetical protein
MALEELLIETYILYGLYSGIALDFDYLVHQQKRVSVWQNLGDLPDIQKCIGAELGDTLLLLSHLIQFPYELLVQCMTALIGHYPALYSPTNQGKIAD